MVAAFHALTRQDLFLFVAKLGEAALKPGNIVAIVVLSLCFIGHKLAN